MRRRAEAGSPLAEAAAELQARHIPDWDKPAAQHRDSPAADRDWDRRAANIVVQPPAVSRPPGPRWQLLRRRGGAGRQRQVGRASLKFPLAWLVGPWRVGGRVRCTASRLGVPRTTRCLRLWSRRLLLASLRPASGTALVGLVRVVMRMLLLVAVRRCVAALREGGYRRRQGEAGKQAPRNTPTAIVVDFLMLPLRNGRPSAGPPC